MTDVVEGAFGPVEEAPEVPLDGQYYCDEPGCEFSSSTEGGLRRHQTRTHGRAPAVTRVRAPKPKPPDEPVIEGEPVEERRPEATTPRKGLLERLRPKPEEPKPEDAATPAAKPRPPRRVSTQAFWGELTEAGSGLVARAGYVPMARAMEWSSPVAGEIIEDATKGTLPDRLVQPIVRNTEKWQDLFDLIGFWGAIGMAQAQPEKSQMALGFARKRLVNLLPRIASNIAKQRKKEKAAAEALGLLMPDLAELGLKEGDDPIQALLEMLFAPPANFTAAPEAEPAPAA